MHASYDSINFISGIGVLFSHLPIEQYRSASWLNVACGLVLLLVFVFFFRGESKSDCSKTKNRGNVCGSRKNCPEDTPRPGALQIFISTPVHDDLYTISHIAIMAMVLYV